eukprot:tig00021037_g17472.t1
MDGQCSLRGGEPTTVYVTTEAIHWSVGSKVRIVRLRDVLSAVAATPHLMLASSPAGRNSPGKPAKQGLAQAAEDAASVSPALWIVYCVPFKGMFAKERRLREYAFRAEDAASAQRWVRAINNGAFGGAQKKQRVLVVLNPVSGSGKSRKVGGQLLPLLKLAGADVTLEETTHAGHAIEIGKKLDRSRYDMVLTVGGDGILHELLNGLLARPDWASAVTVPLLPVPAGTGNGLAHSLGVTDVHTAALVVARGKSRPMDVAAVLQEAAAGAPLQRKAFSFLSLTWAIIADVDLGTENLRWMGELRNTVGGVKAILARTLYRGRISMYTGKGEEGVLKLAHGPLRLPPVHFPLNSPGPVEADGAGGSSGSDGPSAAKPAPAAASQTVLRCGGDCAHCARAPAAGAPASPPPRAVGPPGAEGPPSRVDFDSVRKGQPGPGWTVLEGEFLLFLASNVPMIGADFCGTPFAHLSDGHFDVLVIRKAGRGSLLGAFLRSETGDMVHEPVSEYYKCSAVLVEPDISQSGYVALDGERLPYAPVGLEVHRGLARVAYWEHQKRIEQRLPARDRKAGGGGDRDPCF